MPINSSALFAKTMETAGEKEKARLLAIFRKRRELTTAADIAWVTNLYRRHGVIDWEEAGKKKRMRGWAVEEADRLCRQAVALVDDMSGFGTPQQADRFKALMRLMAKRES